MPFPLAYVARPTRIGTFLRAVVAQRHVEQIARLPGQPTLDVVGVGDRRKRAQLLGFQLSQIVVGVLDRGRRMVVVGHGRFEQPPAVVEDVFGPDLAGGGGQRADGVRFVRLDHVAHEVVLGRVTRNTPLGVGLDGLSQPPAGVVKKSRPEGRLNRKISQQ